MRSLMLVFILSIGAIFSITFPFSAYSSERSEACQVAFRAARGQCVAQKNRAKMSVCMDRAREEIKQCIADDPDPSKIIAIKSPGNDTTVTTRVKPITGHILNPRPSYSLTVNGYPGSIEEDGTFNVGYPLDTGLNMLVLSLYDSDQEKTIDSVTLDITYIPAREAVASFTVSSGGLVEVTDPASPIFGAKFAVGPNGLQRDFMVSLDHDPEHMSNLPLAYVQVGEPVALYPIGEVLNLAGLLTIPFDSTLLPNGTTTSDIFVLALGDGKWRELPARRLGVSAVTVTIDAVWYEPFVAAVRKP